MIFKTRHGRVSQGMLAVVMIASAVHGQTVWNDPAGDVVFGGPDIVAISAGYARSQLRLTASFAAGTLTNLGNYGFYFFLDVDRNTNTSAPGGLPYGTDSYVRFNALENPGTAVVVRDNVITGYAPVLFGSNSLGVVFPLEQVGASNGSVNFSFASGTAFTPNSIIPTDHAPDLNAGGVTAQPFAGPATEIPELRTSVTNGQLTLSWANGSNYVLEASSAPLPGASWSGRSNVVNTPNGGGWFTEPATNAARFYRLRRE